ncbi:MAG: DUF2384 domain-containing protein [Acidobacteriia bacterium]|nr:DUF2384 domain-containing protein [Terriglobia bacterium]
MASLERPIAVESAEQSAAELAQPNPNAIRNRAVEIFGDESKARSWLNMPRDLFGGSTPEKLIESGNPDEQRRVLEILIRIDHGVFS